MRSKLGEKLEVGQKRDEYLKSFAYLSGSLAKQKRPLHKERRKRLALPNYLKELLLGRNLPVLQEMQYNQNQNYAPFYCNSVI